MKKIGNKLFAEAVNEAVNTETNCVQVKHKVFAGRRAHFKKMFAYPLKVNSQCFKLHIDLIQFHLICEMLAKFSVVEIIRPHLSLEKR